MNYQKKYYKAKRACYYWMALWAVTVIVFVLLINNKIGI